MVDFASAQAAGSLVKLNKSDNWLRQCQGVALPILSPSTIESRTYYFESLPLFLGPSTKAGKTSLKLEPFAAHWNASADGIKRSYLTPEVFTTYGKVWGRVSNNRASQDRIRPGLEQLATTAQIFAAPDVAFPSFISTFRPTKYEPTSAIATLEGSSIPSFLSIGISASQPLASASSAVRSFPPLICIRTLLSIRHVG